jgi:hypothetical protein
VGGHSARTEPSSLLALLASRQLFGCASWAQCKLDASGTPQFDNELYKGYLGPVSGEFLVAYDYGMGGLWGVVVAESADQIVTRYPEVVIAAERPAWMDDADFERLRREVLDINSRGDEGIFKAVVADRSK